MPGKVIAIVAAAGDAVAKGQTLLVVEAMKMEHALAAPFDGRLSELAVMIGTQVREGQRLAVVERGTA